MSIRLNVVVVQSPRMTNLQVGIVAEIVIQLLGRPGIDLAMVESLESDDEHSTDRLMLSSLENDVAIIDWRSTEQTLKSLALLGVDASRAPFVLDPDAPSVSPGTRRVYVVDLRNGFKPKEVVEAIMKLLELRQVVTVTLAIPGKPASNGQIQSAKTKPLTPETSTALAETTATGTTPASGERPIRLDSQAPAQSQRTSLDATLDDLVDSLNNIDL